ncbi:MAG: hypothetical protein AAF585_07205 [Verrucomicrobiota bacterium]
MKLLGELRLISEFSAVTCGPGGGKIERIKVPFYHGEAEFAESDLDGLLVTGDLQFYDRKDVPEKDRILMGYIVSQEIAELCDAALLPPRDKIAAILTGDMYAIPSLLERGGLGDVDDVWLQFADDFRWVAGVAGNHDYFSGKAEFSGTLLRESNIYPLDGDLIEVDGLKIGGISGISGNPSKAWRYADAEFITNFKQLCFESIDIMILHQGPIGQVRGQRGFGLINELIRGAKSPPALVTFGHCWWPDPVSDEGGATLLNVDGGVVLLTRPGANLQL